MSFEPESAHSPRFQVRRAFYHPAPAGLGRWRVFLLLFFFLLFSVLLQSLLGIGLGAGGFRPNLVLLAAVYWALRSRGHSWVWVALAAGLLLDGFSAARPGLGPIEMLFTCGLVVLATRPLLRDSAAVTALAVLGAALVSPLIYYLLLAIFAEAPPLAAAWRRAIWPHFWQTAVAALVWLPLARFLLGRETDSREGGWR